MDITQVVFDAKKQFTHLDELVSTYYGLFEDDIKAYCSGIHDVIYMYDITLHKLIKKSKNHPEVRQLIEYGQMRSRSIYKRYIDTINTCEFKNRHNILITEIEQKYEKLIRTIPMPYGNIKFFERNNNSDVVIKKARFKAKCYLLDSQVKNITEPCISEEHLEDLKSNTDNDIQDFCDLDNPINNIDVDINFNVNTYNTNDLLRTPNNLPERTYSLRLASRYSTAHIDPSITQPTVNPSPNSESGLHAFDLAPNYQQHYSLSFKEQSSILYEADTSYDDAIRESRWYKICKKDNHPGMVRCYDSFFLGNYHYIITKKAKKGNISDFFQFFNENRRTGKIYTNTGEVSFKSIYMDVLYSIMYLHDHMRVAHLDLKMGNIFLSDDYVPIIGDFGLAKVIGIPDYLDEQNVVDYCEEIEFDILPTLTSAYTEERQNVNSLYSLQDNLKQLTITPGLSHSLENDTNPYFEAYYQVKHIHKQITDMFDCSQLDFEHKRESLFRFPQLKTPGGSIFEMSVSDYIPEYHLSLLPCEEIEGMRGTLIYMCPWLFHHNYTLPFAADIYSLGVVLFQLVTSFHPYGDEGEGTEGPAFYFLHTKKIGVRELLKMYQWEHRVDSEIIDVLELMMATNPTERPSISQCIQLLADCDFDLHYQLLDQEQREQSGAYEDPYDDLEV